ncbi:VG15 protein [Nocardia niigatensis]
MPSTAELRSAVASLAVIADADVDALWAQITNAPDMRAALMDILPALIDTYGSAAAAFAADWYDNLAEEAELPARFTAVPAELTSTGAESLAGWTTSALFSEVPTRGAAQLNFDLARSRLTGGLQLRIANAARDTITGSSIADPRADGWQRVASGGGCGFCQMLAGRGTVYRKATVDFASHDHCGCTAVPAWGGRPRPVKAYTPTSANITDADRARTRAWIAANL